MLTVALNALDNLLFKGHLAAYDCVCAAGDEVIASCRRCWPHGTNVCCQAQHEAGTAPDGAACGGDHAPECKTTELLNDFAGAVVAAGGLDLLEKLQHHAHADIRGQVNKILQSYTLLTRAQRAERDLRRKVRSCWRSHGLV